MNISTLIFGVTYKPEAKYTITELRLAFKTKLHLPDSGEYSPAHQFAIYLADSQASKSQSKSQERYILTSNVVAHIMSQL